MSLYKRPDSSYWWVLLSANGETIRRSTKTKKKTEAQLVHDKLQRELWMQDQGLKKPRKWSEGKAKFLREKAPKKSIADITRHMDFWEEYLGHLKLSDVTTEVISDIELPFTISTANRYKTTLKSFLKTANKNWGWTHSVPYIHIEKEPNKRIRWITREEANRLIAALPDYLQEPAEFSLQVGLRQSNVLGLQWSQIDLLRKTAWIYGDQAKGEDDIAVPLNEIAMNILYSRANKRSGEYVFTNRKGNKIPGIDSRTWAKSLKKAGITNFKWHDLRHTWASWHVQTETTLRELMDLGGWKTYEMVLRYSHLSSRHLLKTSGNIVQAASPDQMPLLQHPY